MKKPLKIRVLQALEGRGWVNVPMLSMLAEFRPARAVYIYMERLRRATEAAHYLKVKVRTLLLWARQGKVKGYALSGTKRHVWRFRRADLDAALMESPVLPSMVPSVLVKGIP